MGNAAHAAPGTHRTLMHKRLALVCTSSLALALAAQQQPPAPQQPAAPKVAPTPSPALPDVKTTGAPLFKLERNSSTVRQSAPPRAAQPKLASTDPSAPAAPPLPAPGLMHDEVDGALWTVGGTYKASFDRTGATFIPFFANAPRNYPLHFTVRSASAAGEPLAIAAALPVRSDAVVTFDHGALRAEYDLEPAAIEQKFVFDRLPARGELRVVVDVATDLVPSANGAGFLFSNELGRVTFGGAIAIDAAGDRTTVVTMLEQGVMTFVVPAAFVAHARLPLVIDPLVGSTQAVYSSTYPQLAQRADIAYEPSWGEYCVVHERVWSGTDIDVFAHRYSYDLSSSTMHIVDSTSQSWERPGVAANNAADRFLVVAQYSAAHASPFSVTGRLIDAGTGVLSAQFTIESAAVAGHAAGDKLVPVVGGDMDYQAPTYFTVVWERAWSATDHDVHMKQVNVDGSLRTNAPVLLDNSASYDSVPSISKTDGTPPYAGQCWGIVWQRRFSPTDEDIYGAMVRWDGTITQPTFAVNGSSISHYEPVVSSPTDEQNGSRRYLVAYTQYNTGTDADVVGTVIDGAGGWHTQANLTSTLSTAQNEFLPCVDSDGARFVLGCSQRYGSGNDYDALAVTYGYSDALGLVQQDLDYPGYTTDQEWAPAITSTHAAGSGAARYGMAWTRYDLANTSLTHVETRLYDGMSAYGGITTRPTACGSDAASIVLGTPALGGTLYYQQAQTGGFRGFLFGLPTSAPIGVCPGCTLGVNGSSFVGDFLNVDIPVDPTFVGLTLACQAFSFQSGPCLGSVSLDDTIDATLR